MNEELSRFYYDKGLELIFLEKDIEAIESLKKSVLLDDKNSTAWNLLGLCYYKLCRLKMAEYCWKESLKADMQGNRAEEYIKQLETHYAEYEKIESEVDRHVSGKRFKEAHKAFERSSFYKDFNTNEVVKNYSEILRKQSIQNSFFAKFASKLIGRSQ